MGPQTALAGAFAASAGDSKPLTAARDQSSLHRHCGHPV